MKLQTIWYDILIHSVHKLAASPEVCHTSCTHTHTLWGELAAHPGAVEEPKGDTPKSLPSQCQRAEREKRQSTPVTDATAKGTHTRSHALSYVWERQIHFVVSSQRGRIRTVSGRVVMYYWQVGDDILILYWSIFSLYPATGGSVVGGRLTLQSVDSCQHERFDLTYSWRTVSLKVNV